MTDIALKGLLCITLCVLPACTHADTETYVPKEIAHLPWGSSPEAVGLILPDEEQEAQGPDAIAVDALGRVYLLDVVNCRVQQYSAEGDFLQSMPLQIAGHALCVTDDGMLYVLDPFTHSIAQYDLEGSLLGEYTFELPPQLSGDLPVTRIMKGPGGGIWLGTYRDVYPVELVPRGLRVGRLRKGIPGDVPGTYYVIERVTKYRSRSRNRYREHPPEFPCGVVAAVQETHIGPVEGVPELSEEIVQTDVLRLVGFSEIDISPQPTPVQVRMWGQVKNTVK